MRPPCRSCGRGRYSAPGESFFPRMGAHHLQRAVAGAVVHEEDFRLGGDFWARTAHRSSKAGQGPPARYNRVRRWTQAPKTASSVVEIEHVGVGRGEKVLGVLKFHLGRAGLDFIYPGVAPRQRPDGRYRPPRRCPSRRSHSARPGRRRVVGHIHPVEREELLHHRRRCTMDRFVRPGKYKG